MPPVVSGAFGDDDDDDGSAAVVVDDGCCCCFSASASQPAADDDVDALFSGSISMRWALCQTTRSMMNARNMMPDVVPAVR